MTAEEKTAADQEKADDIARFTKYYDKVGNIPLVKSRGRVKDIVGLAIVSEGPVCNFGDICRIDISSGRSIDAEVVGFYNKDIMLMPIGPLEGITPGCPVYSSGQPLSVMCSERLLGSVLNGVGKPLDGSALDFYVPPIPVIREASNALERKRIREPIQTGVKVIDSILTVGKGQRLAIMSAAGVGKSTLLSMVARNTEAQVTVIALVGERRREVLDFIERDLGPEGLKRSIVVVATSDDPPMVRVRAAFTATTIAEYFREQGADVMFLCDSLTRLAYAQREIGLSAGQPPTTRGYPPSVFDMLPKLLERTGNSAKGTITAFYNVLVEGDDLDEPITDAVRGIVDGHIVLSRELAAQGHYPAVDVNASISRLASEVTSPLHNKAANRLRQLYANYNSVKDLIMIGGYVKGSSPEVDEAIRLKPKMDAFLEQAVFEPSPFNETKRELLSLFYAPAEVAREMQDEGAAEAERRVDTAGDTDAAVLVSDDIGQVVL
ncbi:MAG: FliI/YscN family ATPase [Spirochaetes bacterium]|nr:FliI/YscN family ATPase [Spirochaetota bacterium]